MFYLQLAAVVLWLFISGAIGLICCPFRWVGVDLNRLIAQVYARGSQWITGVSSEVQNPERVDEAQPCVYVINHQSMLDLTTMGTLFPRRTIVIGKQELIWLPFFGLFFLAAGNSLINRGKSAQAIASLKKVVDRVRNEKVSIWVFPEGTRSGSQVDLLPFKKGPFHMAVDAGVPIVPIVSSSLAPFFSLQKRYFRRGKVKIRVLPPIPTAGMSAGDVNALMEKTRNQMLEAFHRP